MKIIVLMFACNFMVYCKWQNHKSLPQYKSLVTTDSNSLSKKGLINYYNPLQADVTFNPDVALNVTSEVYDIKFPIIKFNLVEADFVQIMRCNKSFQLVDETGNNINKIKSSYEDITSKKWAWNQALSTTSSCQIVSTRFSGTKFADYSAPSGWWYYILNPCVSTSISTTAQEGCSYHLKISHVVKYKSALKQNYRDTVKEVMVINDKLQAKLQLLSYLSKQLSIQLEACESQVSIDTAYSNVKEGLFYLGGIAVGSFTIGMVLGPYFGGLIGQQLVSSYLVPYLGIASSLNTCLSGQLSADEVKQLSSKYQKKQITTIINNENKYEKLYHSADIRSRIEILLKKGGPIDSLMDEVKEKYTALEKTNDHVISINQALVSTGVSKILPSSDKKVKKPQSILQNVKGIFSGVK